MAFIIGLPVAQIILFCLAIGHDPTGLPIAVSNHELSPGLLAQQECPIYDGCNYTLLSCRYLSYLQNRSVVVVSEARFPLFSIYIIMRVTFRCFDNRPTSPQTKKRMKWCGEEKHGAPWYSPAIIRSRLSNERNTVKIPPTLSSTLLTWMSS